MYIIELFCRVYQKLTQKKSISFENKEDTTSYEGCEHIFVPIDSTKKILACTKCGLVLKREEVEKKYKNFFKGE